MPLHLVGRTVRKIDVEQDACAEARLDQRLDDLRRVRLRRLADRVVARVEAVGLAERDRGNAEERPLHRAGDGARIGDVVGHVLAAVDAGEDEVGPFADHLLEAP